MVKEVAYAASNELAVRRNTSLRARPGIAMESTKCDGLSVDGLGMESPAPRPPRGAAAKSGRHIP